MTGQADCYSALSKEQIRERMREHRLALSQAQVRQSADGLAEMLPQLLVHLRSVGQLPYGRIHLGSYAAIRNEADLSLAIAKLDRRSVDIYYPAVFDDADNGCLRFARLPNRLTEQAFLKTGRFGIPEPPASACPANLPKLDALLMPGLAFDRQGNRLGWGGAFYDRLLTGVEARPILVGICYGFQILDQLLPVEKTDQAVDYLLTPEGYRACES